MTTREDLRVAAESAAAWNDRNVDALEVARSAVSESYIAAHLAYCALARHDREARSPE